MSLQSDREPVAVVPVAETKADPREPSALPSTSSAVAGISWVLPGLVLLLFALRTLGPLKDPDAYWHIAAGEHLQQTGQFVLADPFGAATDKVWILNQWLPEVVMHRANAAFGLPGVAWLLCLCSFLVGVCVYRSCRRWSPALVSALVLAVAFVALSGSLSPRPQLVTFGLTAISLSAWLATREDRRPRWWLVPLSWLWACSHGMWFVGPAVGGLVLVGMVLERRTALRSAARLSLVPVLSVAVAGLTPVGLRLFTSPFQVGGVTAYISEWQRPEVASPAVVASLFLAVIVALGQRRPRSRIKPEWTVWLLVALSLALTLCWSRTVGLAAVLLAPLAAKALTGLLSQGAGAVGRREHAAVATAGLVGLTIAAVLAPTVAAAPAIGPNGLDAALSQLPAGTVVCNDQRDGGWLMLRHPNVRPTMDTRVELYSLERIEGYLGFLASEPGWQNYISAVGCTQVVLPSSTPVVSALRGAGDWQVASEAGGYVMLSR